MGKTVPMTFNFEKTRNIGILKFYGELTCLYAGKVKEAFLVSLSNSDHLIVDFKGVSSMDRSFMEQLQRARRTASGARKKLLTINLRLNIAGENV